MPKDRPTASDYDQCAAKWSSLKLGLINPEGPVWYELREIRGNCGGIVVVDTTFAAVALPYIRVEVCYASNAMGEKSLRTQVALDNALDQSPGKKVQVVVWKKRKTYSSSEQRMVAICVYRAYCLQRSSAGLTRGRLCVESRFPQAYTESLSGATRYSWLPNSPFDSSCLAGIVQRKLTKISTP
ncbi:hypothetical protein K438DRAFT_1765037 [Mycena galopus ATCC 62051]|nr:hypothetical protein K438DRAFT_1765037 [Mycena galopus ATCC 62051]